MFLFNELLAAIRCHDLELIVVLTVDVHFIANISYVLIAFLKLEILLNLQNSLFILNRINFN